MRLGSKGIRLIQRFEGFRARAYTCPGGFLTIGFGHLIKSGEEMPEEITKSEAEDLLRQDLASVEQALKRLIQVSLTQAQVDALGSFIFNLGSGAFQRSTLRCKVNREEHALVPQELMRWTRASGRILSGLVARRQAEAALYTCCE